MLVGACDALRATFSVEFHYEILHHDLIFHVESHGTFRFSKFQLLNLNIQTVASKIVYFLRNFYTKVETLSTDIKNNKTHGKHIEF